MADTHAVTDITSLQRVLSLGRGSRVVVALPSFADEESGRFQDQLNRLVSECGCSMSACALVLGVIACGLFDAAHWAAATAHIFKTLGMNLLACFAAAGLGRSAGRLRAKWRLARTVEAIGAQLACRASA
jgi:hypothetical protein